MQPWPNNSERAGAPALVRDNVRVLAKDNLAISRVNLAVAWAVAWGCRVE